MFPLLNFVFKFFKIKRQAKNVQMTHCNFKQANKWWLLNSCAISNTNTAIVIDLVIISCVSWQSMGNSSHVANTQAERWIFMTVQLTMNWCDFHYVIGKYRSVH